jgi:hypothetical protein
MSLTSTNVRSMSGKVGRHTCNRKSNEIHASQEGRKVAVGKVVACLCLKLIVRNSKLSVEHGRMVTTSNITKH